MKMLTSGDLCRITGVDQATLQRWISNGYLQPSNNGKGTGVHRRYSLMDAVAVSYAEFLRREGWGSEHVADALRLLSSLSENELCAKFKEGFVMVFPVPNNPYWVKDHPDLPSESRTTLMKYSLAREFDRVADHARRLIEARELLQQK